MQSKWLKTMLISGLTAVVLIYQMVTATEAPSQALAVLQYCLLACALIGVVGSIAMFASGK